jgi:hypothetical protein
MGTLYPASIAVEENSLALIGSNAKYASSPPPFV